MSVHEAVADTTSDVEQVSGVWRSNWEFSALLAESSVRANIKVGIVIGYTTIGIYQMGFLNKNFDRRVRKGTHTPEYSVETQLEALSDALDNYCKFRTAEERERWEEVAKEMIQG